MLAALSPYMVASALGVRADLTAASLTGARDGDGDGDGGALSPWPVRVAALAVGASLAVLRATYMGPSTSSTFGAALAPAPRAATPAAAKPKPKRLARSPARRAA